MLTYPDKLFSDMCLVVWIWIVSVHELDGVEDTNGIEGVVVLVDVVLHHHIKEVPAYVVVWSYAFVGI